MDIVMHYLYTVSSNITYTLSERLVCIELNNKNMIIINHQHESVILVNNGRAESLRQHTS